MRIRNATRGTVIAEGARVARTLPEKIKGLLGEKTPNAMVFRTRWGIHTIGMRFPIDCIVCDSDGRVKATRVDLYPGRFFMWNPLWSILIELPAGTIKESGTQIGDEIEFSEPV